MFPLEIRCKVMEVDGSDVPFEGDIFICSSHEFSRVVLVT